MSLKPLLSFSSGELDPVLTDNVTLEKFNKGLTTARNVMIGKTGSILSRFGRKHCVMAKNADEKIKIYCPPNTDYVLLFGPSYLRIYSFVPYDLTLQYYMELATSYTEDDLINLHFDTSKDFVYIFCKGFKLKKLELAYLASAYVAEADIFKLTSPLTTPTVVPSGTPTGYKVDYLCTLVINGEETLHTEVTTGYNKPISPGQSNLVSVQWLDSSVTFGEVNEVRFYSRPNGGGAYGLLGTSTKITISGPNRLAQFEDIGSLPDYTNGTQDLITKYGLEGKAVIDLKSRTGIVYQQRLILTDETNEEALAASRPGFQNNFYRDFPYAPDSALLFKAGTSGKANVLRIIESDGLVVFTTNGVYMNAGLLSVNNTGLERKGNWIIDETIPPLLVPGGLFFVDRSNIIRQMIFSQEILAYESVEQTIFSNHLFKNRKIVSWSYQEGLASLIIVNFSDGTFATFTYSFEHQMRAWTRHDSVYPVEQVEGTGQLDRTFFVVNKNGHRSVEVTVPRRAHIDILVQNPEEGMLINNVFMDSIKTSYTLLNDFFDTGEHVTITPNTPGDWESELNFYSPFSIAGYVVGTVLRVFHPDTKNAVDLTVTATIDGNNVTVQPSEEFPSDLATTARVYVARDGVTGLDHLEGEKVAVMVDGALVSSPYNDVEGYAEIVVTGGAITLPDGMLGAIIHVGRPIAGDAETLNVSTVEQSPTLIESVNLNKAYVRVNESRGLYVGNNLPVGNSVKGMDSLDEALVPQSGELIGNTYFPPVSKRCEVTVPGSWDTQGKFAIRQVDPYHFEILSIIPDLTVLTRSDR